MEYMDHVRQHTGRTLSRQGSSFNTFAGITAHFAQILSSFNNLYGLTVITSIVGSFSHAFTWIHRFEEQ
jgi:ATP-dependent protease HslVU (ClpYQ) peptidase subunit